MITPPATLLCHRDVEGNSVATATFDVSANQLAIESEVVIQQFNEAPLDFLVADYAVDYPFTYQPDDRIILLPFMAFPEEKVKIQLTEWIAGFWKPDERIQTYTLLQRLGTHINQTLSVSTPGRTRRTNCGANTGFRHRFMPGFCVAVYGSRAVLRSRLALCQRISSRTAISGELWVDPCLG